MNLEMYSVFDVKAQAFGTPFAMQNDALAVRAFAEHCQNEEEMFFKYPEDFQLYRVGNFNQRTGETEGYKPELITTAIEQVQPKTADPFYQENQLPISLEDTQ